MKRFAPPVFLFALVSLLVISTAPVHLHQQPAAADRFEVSDVMIPARDGKRLHTKIFTPRPSTSLRAGDQAGPLPIIFKRTPYGIEGSAGNFNAFYKALADEGTDTYDSIDWLLKNVRNNNGRVGMLGVSYDGWTTIMGAIDPHLALKAISPQASPADMWMGDDFHHNGAFRLSYGFEYAAMMESGKDVQ